MAWRRRPSSRARRPSGPSTDARRPHPKKAVPVVPRRPTVKRGNRSSHAAQQPGPRFPRCAQTWRPWSGFPVSACCPSTPPTYGGRRPPSPTCSPAKGSRSGWSRSETPRRRSSPASPPRGPPHRAAVCPPRRAARRRRGPLGQPTIHSDRTRRAPVRPGRSRRQGRHCRPPRAVHGDRLPVGVTIFVEGEEESGVRDARPVARAASRRHGRCDRDRRQQQLGDRRPRAHHVAAGRVRFLRRGPDPRPCAALGHAASCPTR